MTQEDLDNAWVSTTEEPVLMEIAPHKPLAVLSAGEVSGNNYHTIQVDEKGFVKLSNESIEKVALRVIELLGEK